MNEVNSSQNNLKSKFHAIKSTINLKNIFKLLHRKRILEIIKYNKNLKNSLNIELKDYIDYSGIYSSVEIEIIPDRNKYDKFINIFKKRRQSYFHIFFNYGKKERKTDYLKKSDLVFKIRIKIDYQIKSFYKLFNDCESIKSVIFTKYYRNNINMSYMFCGCTSLEEVNFSKFKFYNFTDTSHMFSGCSSLKELNLSNFNTSEVTNMESMFFGCSSLKKLDLSNFIIDKVSDMKYMFSECTSIELINISNFNMNNMKNMSHLFSKCTSLKELYMPDINTNLIIDMKFMFYECPEELKSNIKDKLKNLKEEAFY